MQKLESNRGKGRNNHQVMIDAMFVVLSEVLYEMEGSLGKELAHNVSHRLGVSYCAKAASLL